MLVCLKTVRQFQGAAFHRLDPILDFMHEIHFLFVLLCSFDFSIYIEFLWVFPGFMPYSSKYISLSAQTGKSMFRSGKASLSRHRTHDIFNSEMGTFCSSMYLRSVVVKILQVFPRYYGLTLISLLRSPPHYKFAYLSLDVFAGLGNILCCCCYFTQSSHVIYWNITFRRQTLRPNHNLCAILKELKLVAWICYTGNLVPTCILFSTLSLSIESYFCINNDLSLSERYYSIFYFVAVYSRILPRRGWGGEGLSLVLQLVYHPRPRSFKKHPKRGFF